MALTVWLSKRVNTESAQAMTVPNAELAAKSARTVASRQAKSVRQPKTQILSFAQVAPAALILLFFFIAPFCLILAVSFFDFTRTEIIPTFILDNYVEVLTSSLTLHLYLSSLRLFAIVWICTLLIGFCLANFLVFHIRTNTLRMGLLLLCAIPFWTSGIIRMISWVPFLGREGLFNHILIQLGVTNKGFDFLLFSNFSVILVYVHQYSALMMGPIANSMFKIDRSLIEAARDAGASRWQILRLIIVPLSKTGIMLGTILVFTAVMGDAIIISQMSGQQSASVVSELSTEIGSVQYPPAAASAVLLVIFVSICVAAAMRIVDIRKELSRQGGS